MNTKEENKAGKRDVNSQGGVLCEILDGVIREGLTQKEALRETLKGKRELAMQYLGEHYRQRNTTRL